MMTHDKSGTTQNRPVLAADPSKPQDGVTHLLEQLAQKPDHPAILLALADAYANSLRLSEAEITYRHLLSIKPEFPNAARNLGKLFFDQELFEEASLQFIEALKREDSLADNWLNLALAASASGQHEMAIALLEEATQRFPEHQEVRFLSALLYLKTGQWHKGWPLYESRWQPGEYPPGPFPEKTWRGNSPANLNVLITAEQGLGDFLLFARYLPLLARITQNLCLWAPPSLWRLLQASFPDLPIYNPLRKDNPTVDLQIPIGSLPLIMMHEGIVAPPRQLPYLNCHLAEDAAIGDILLNHRKHSDERPIIGIVWRGRPEYADDHKRSTSLSALLREFSLEQFRPVSLQIGPTKEESELMESTGIPDLSPALKDFHATATALCLLDGLVSVDTAAANLAAALNRALILLQRANSDWRWGTDQTGSAWFNEVTPISIPR